MADIREVLSKLHRTVGQLRAIAEHLRQLAEDLDGLIDQSLPGTEPLTPPPAAPGGPPPSTPPSP